MKALLFVFVFFASTGNAYLTRNLPVKFCAVMKDWKNESLSPQELCKKYGGSFCPTVQNMGQAICSAAGGSFCSSAQSVGEGICRAGNGSSCNSTLSEVNGLCAALGMNCETNTDDRKVLFKRLEEVCGT